MMETIWIFKCLEDTAYQRRDSRTMCLCGLQLLLTPCMELNFVFRFQLNARPGNFTHYEYIQVGKRRISLALSGLDFAIMKPAQTGGDRALQVAVGSQSIVQLGLLMALPMFMEIGLERTL
ncbi:unnamed protein product [Urochloa humidicola]